MIFPKVTRSLGEFMKLSKMYKIEISLSMTLGFYRKNVIWLKNNSSIVLLHELVHWILKKPQEKYMHINILLFFDILDTIHDFINKIIFSKACRDKVHIGFKVIVNAWNDFLDWQLCRDVGV